MAEAHPQATIENLDDRMLKECNWWWRSTDDAPIRDVNHTRIAPTMFRQTQESVRHFVALCSLCFLFSLTPCANGQQESDVSPSQLSDRLSNDPPTMTHGPMLGGVTHESIRVWARTSMPTEFEVRYQVVAARGEESRSAELVVPTSYEQSVKAESTGYGGDCTGYVTLEGLESDTRYRYQVFIQDLPQGTAGSFKTLPDAQALKDQQFNPHGLFNFSFEIGCCANQNPMHGIGHSLPTYQTMNRTLADKVDFAIMNGDWLYEELRDTPPAAWAVKNRLPEADLPKVVDVMPTIVGVWENYKLYMSRGFPLMKWHRNVPSYFTFDDHELVNDIWGAGSAGRRHRRTVFRDIGTRAWHDYLGWANPVENSAPIHFGKAELKQGSDLLVDRSADFTKLPLDSMSNLHIHWGTPTAGINEIQYDDDSGDPNSRVYSIREVVDANTLRLHMPAAFTGTSSYSIGRRNYGKFRVANCDIYLLDTRSHRDMHDIRQPDKPGLSMLGLKQRKWLMDSMAASDADFFFVVSSVPMFIPHSGAGGFEFDEANKEEAWVAFLDEREMLVDFWDGLKRPVMVMTGDLHNSFAIRVTDRVWEFCCGPHNSVNHVPKLDEDDRPPTGWYQSGERYCDIRWSSYILPDIPRLDRCYPYYCVVRVNNVFNMPQKLGSQRLVAYPHPQVILQYFHGRTGELAYSETITADHGVPELAKKEESSTTP